MTGSIAVTDWPPFRRSPWRLRRRLRPDHAGRPSVAVASPMCHCLPPPARGTASFQTVAAASKQCHTAPGTPHGRKLHATSPLHPPAVARPARSIEICRCLEAPFCDRIHTLPSVEEPRMAIRVVIAWLAVWHCLTAAGASWSNRAIEGRAVDSVECHEFLGRNRMPMATSGLRGGHAAIQ